MAKKTSTKSKTSSKTTTNSQGRSSAKTAKATSAKPAAKTKPAVTKTVKSSASKAKADKLQSGKPQSGKSKSDKPQASKSKPAARTAASTGKSKTADSKTKPTKSPKPPVEAKALSAQAETSRFKINYGQTDNLGEREHLTEDQLRKVKGGLTKKDLATFRELLMQKRSELRGDVESLKADAKNIGANISYEHMADTGSDNYEQEFTLGLVESERQMLHEIDDALVRIDKGIYGICMVTGEPIPRARLEAKPWAKYCIEVAREKERRQAIPRFRA